MGNHILMRGKTIGSKIEESLRKIDANTWSKQDIVVTQ